MIIKIVVNMKKLYLMMVLGLDGKFMDDVDLYFLLILFVDVLFIVVINRF